MEATLIYEQVMFCRACDKANLEPILDLGNQYLPRWVKEIDKTLPQAPLVLVRCKDCGLLQLGHKVNPDLLYREFWYRSAVNQTMRDALKDVVRDGLTYHRSGRWLDIGANDGYLLSQVSTAFERTACEPALNFAAELHGNAEHVVQDYFSAETCTEKYDVITSIACFYDSSEPDKWVSDVARRLTPDGVWINQLNDSPGMLEANAFDAICHEHACYWDLPGLRALYARHGLTIVNVTRNDVNGGSVRITASKSSMHARPFDLAGHGAVSAEDAHAFARRVERWKDEFSDVLEHYEDLGRVYAAGASTKGSVLLQYLGPAAKLITAVGDRNPLKHGTLMAGTWTPVISEEEMRAANPEAVVLLPWAFEKEIVARERQLLNDGAVMLVPLPNIKVIV